MKPGIPRFVMAGLDGLQSSRAEKSLSKTMAKIASSVVFAAFTSCFHEDPAKRPMDREFIADVTPTSPPGSPDLQQFALTLPIFEMTGQAERIQWVTSSQPRRETSDTLVLVGDGAQNSVAIQRISAAGSAVQRIRLIIESQGGGPDSVYELERVPGGWNRMKKRHVEGAWDKIYQSTPSDGDRS